MGGSPPPPPPKRQPRETAKELSMYYRNLAFRYAIEAATDSYTAAVVVKTLADILLPVTETQLRNEINDHYRIITEYRRSVIIYSTTVQTFLDVDSLVKASINKLNTIRRVGETYLDDFDRSVIKFITDGITEVYTQQSNLQKMFVDASAHLDAVKQLYETSPLPAAEKDALYEKELEKIQTLCNESRALYTAVASKIDEMKTRVDQEDSLTQADASRTTITAASVSARENLTGVVSQIDDVYTKNVKDYNAELARRKKWYEYYRKQADLVRQRQNIVINPAVFRRLMNWAQNAHLNAVYAALFAVNANVFAYTNRDTVNPYNF